MRYWQIACGSEGREYSKQCIRFGMAFVGGKDHVETIGHVELGDRVLLKKGNSEVMAAGPVVKRNGKYKGKDDKDWTRDFDGWDLNGYCFVDWHLPKHPVPTKGLTRTTIQRVHTQELKDLADKILSEVPAQESIEPEPRQTRRIQDEEILDFLIRRGLRPSSAQDLTVALNRIRLLANYYYEVCHWSDIREHETRTFLIVPLLIALGWAEQQMKIELPGRERKRADLACFSKPFARKNEECMLLIESKGFSHGLDYAHDQAKAYAKNFSNCRVVVVSNGFCYKAFRREGKGGFSEHPSAYLNLLKPRDRYPLDPEKVEGSLETLGLLLPSSSP